MSQLAFSMCQNSKEVGSHGSEEMDLPEKVMTSRYEKEITSFSYVLYIGCHKKLWQRLKADLSTSNVVDQNWVFQVQMTRLRKKTLIGVYQATWVLVNSRYSLAYKQE